MKAVQYAQFGQPEVLQWVDVPAPRCDAHEVRLRVHAAGVNPIDYKTRQGKGFVAERLTKRLPWIPGYDVAGEVIEVGDKVQTWQVGDRVCGLVNFPLPGGCYAEEVCVPADELVRIPEGLSDEVAAALPLAGLTAWQGLFEIGHLMSGQNVLVLAAAGGVGHLAAQLARIKGCKVWGTASPANHDALSGLGITPVDYHDQEAMEALPEMDFVFDGVGGQAGEAALERLAEGAELVTLPTLTAEAIEKAARAQGKVARGYMVHPDRGQLQSLLEQVQGGQLKVWVQQVFPASGVIDAHRLIEGGHVRGKLVLDFTAV